MIDPEGEQMGVMSPEEGLEKAEEYGLDLVEVAPKARPPVCRIMDYGKYKYQQSKKKSSSRSDNVQLKTFRMRPNIGDHDLQVKLKQAGEALMSGDQVKLVMRLRGREHAFTDRWIQKLQEIVVDLRTNLGRDTKLTQAPSAEGREITAMIEPA